MANKNEEDGQLVSVGAAWINESKNGNKYLNVKFNKLLMFKNEKKKNEKEPDYRIVASVGGKKEDKSRQSEL